MASQAVNYNKLEAVGQGADNRKKSRRESFFAEEFHVDRLIKFWGGDYAEPPYIHAEDGFYVRKPYPLPFELMPQPWRGDMFQSKVFLLRLAPALSKPIADYEKASAAFRKTLKINLLGRTPHFLLDPAFKDHPESAGFAASLKGLAPPAQLARHVSEIFLLPYHHKGVAGDAKAQKLIADFPTCDDMRNFVTLNLAPRARAGEVTLILLEGAAIWGFSPPDEGADIVIAETGIDGAKSRATQAIKRQLAAAGAA
jgi:hypothetical protein